MNNLLVEKEFSIDTGALAFLADFQPKTIPGSPVPETLELVSTETLTQVDEESQVVVHCHFMAFPGALVRIWPSTFLWPDGNRSAKVPMVHAENVTYAPVWTQLMSYGVFSFTLLFKGLPKGCTSFDLVEEIEQTGAFHISDIERNNQDVYHVWL
jgi:hypothetical protein